MKEVLKKLSDYQIIAFQKGISFNIDLIVGSDGEKKSVRVDLNYSVSGDITKGFVFSTTFYTADSARSRKLNSIEQFISTVTE